LTQKFRVESISADLASAFWSESPEATGFSHPDVLGRCADRVDWWGAWRSEDLVAVWPVCLAPGGEARSPIFLYYVGPMFSGEIHSFKYHRFQSIRQQALEALMPVIVDRYAAMRFALPPGETDIRVFEWWNHDHPKQARFRIHPRQTARIHDLQRSVEEIRQDMARNRKRDLRLNADRLVGPVDDWKMDEIIELHNEPMQRQAIEIPAERIEALSQVVAAAASGRGVVMAWRDTANGALASVIVLLYGKHEANDVLCVASDAWRERGLAAWTTWQGILQGRVDGKHIFDFNGANSPQRAADKHAYNARAEVYFNIACEPARG